MCSARHTGDDISVMLHGNEKTFTLQIFAAMTGYGPCRYLATIADLQKFAACLHLIRDFPHAILVDDICSFTDDR